MVTSRVDAGLEKRVPKTTLWMYYPHRMKETKCINLFWGIKLRVVLTCALTLVRAHVKVSKSRNLHLILQKNLTFKKHNAQVTR
jgi:hypothetical protein